MSRLLVIALVLLVVICLAEGFPLGTKPLSFAALRNIAQANKLSGARAKRSLTNPLLKSPAQNAVFHAAKASERVREKRSVAHAAKELDLADVNINRQAVNNAMKRIRNLQKRDASFTGLKSRALPPGPSGRR